MDIFDTELIRFYRALQNSGVKYIMVGGYATNIHGYQWYTGDMDIWIEEKKENRLKLRKAFSHRNWRLFYDEAYLFYTRMNRFQIE